MANKTYFKIPGSNKQKRLEALRTGKKLDTDFVNRDTVKLQLKKVIETINGKQKIRYTGQGENSSKATLTQKSKDYLEYQQSDYHRRILTEVVKMYNTFQERKVAKRLTAEWKPGIPFVPENPDQLADPSFMANFRNLSRQRLLDSIQVDLPAELLPFTQETITKLEEYIYKLTGNKFLHYSNKIEDIVFIFEHYPFFKTKILAPVVTSKGTRTTEINIYQLALFEKEISYEARLHIYPVSASVRRNVIGKIISAFRINSQTSTQALHQQKAKEIDLLLFNLSGSQSEYIFNA
jgi:hypothetical protein